MLTVNDVAAHFRLRPDTVRARIKAGDLFAVRINRTYRLNWLDIWACENGPAPKDARIARYQKPLMRKKEVAGALEVSPRTVERWIADGLPTRSVFGHVRLNPDDVRDWLTRRFDLDLPEDWWP